MPVRIINQFWQFGVDNRGGATAIAAACLSVMAVMGIAYVGDHVWLTRQRDLLKNSLNAAVIAIGPVLDEEHSNEEIELIARRYVLANLLGNLPRDRHELASETLGLAIEVDRDLNTFGISAEVELGGPMFGRMFWGDLFATTRARAGIENTESPAEIVMAIDITGSMGAPIALNPINDEQSTSRLETVRAAALAMIETLSAQESQLIAVGLVPFNTTVNIGSSNDSWIVDSSPHKNWPSGFGPRPNCVEERDMEVSVSDSAQSIRSPSEAPFRQFFAPSTLEFDPQVISDTLEIFGSEHSLRGENDWDRNNPTEQYNPSPRFGCPGDEIQPLTTDLTTVIEAIRNLRRWEGGGTMTHIGALWGRRLLSPEWREDWGDEVHPLDWPGVDDNSIPVRKVLVILTDGQNEAYDGINTFPGTYTNNYSTGFASHYTSLGRAGTGRIVDGYIQGSPLTRIFNDNREREFLDEQLQNQCTIAKNAGIVVFTISAVPDGHLQEVEIRNLLENCASTPGHSYTQHSSVDEMRTAFQDIANRIIVQTHRTH